MRGTLLSSQGMDAATELRAELEKALPRLRALDEAAVMRDRGPGKWVRKEILGHLIDSAANNIQRFVRAALDGRLTLQDYDQDGWVALQRYRQRPWREVVDLWHQLNRHVAHAMESVPADRLATPCEVGDDAPVTLGWLMEDYVRHLRHHLSQILS
jgi:hypothetical protein